MTPDQKQFFIDLGDDQLLGRCVYGEARGEGHRGMAAVASVVMNRFHDHTKRYGGTLKSVILKPWQFSCFNANDPNLDKLADGLSGPKWREALTIARLAIDGLLIDETEGSNLYHAADIRPPYWTAARGVFFRRQIGRHKFYQEV